jgi:hypothetical protein
MAEVCHESETVRHFYTQAAEACPDAAWVSNKQWPHAQGKQHNKRACSTLRNILRLCNEEQWESRR